MVEVINIHKIVVDEYEGKKPLDRTEKRRKVNIKWMFER
jgi:hypothetical protein